MKRKNHTGVGTRYPTFLSKESVENLMSSGWIEGDGCYFSATGNFDSTRFCCLTPSSFAFSVSIYISMCRLFGLLVVVSFPTVLVGSFRFVSCRWLDSGLCSCRRHDYDYPHRRNRWCQDQGRCCHSSVRNQKMECRGHVVLGHLCRYVCDLS